MENGQFHSAHTLVGAVGGGYVATIISFYATKFGFPLPDGGAVMVAGLILWWAHAAYNLLQRRYPTSLPELPDGPTPPQTPPPAPPSPTPGA